MSDVGWWLPELREKLEQGDIIETTSQFQPVVPIKYLTRGKTGKHGKQSWDESESISISDNENPRILASISGTHGVVLSYGCEIDKTKDKQAILIAPIASLSTFKDPSICQEILNQKAYRYLPIVGLPDIDDSYANLSKTFALQKQLIGPSSRLVSMTDQGITRLQAQLVGFYTRKKLPNECA